MILTVSYTHLEDGSVAVGQIAKERLITHPKDTAASFKKKMGTTQNYVLGGRNFLPEELSGFVISAIDVYKRQSADSILAAVAGVLVPVFRPLGMGDWRICTSLISGFIAKESVVSTLEVLFAGSIGTVITSLTAASILVFSLLYTPCVAAIASIKRELGIKWAIGVVIWQCVIAWLAALVVHLIGLKMCIRDSPAD